MFVPVNLLGPVGMTMFALYNSSSRRHGDGHYVPQLTTNRYGNWSGYHFRVAPTNIEKEWKHLRRHSSMTRNRVDTCRNGMRCR